MIQDTGFRIKNHASCIVHLASNFHGGFGMKVLVIGAGGREHAIVWKLSQSRHTEKIFCCPGNAGISDLAECISFDDNNFDSLVDFARYERIDLTIVRA